MKKKKSLTSWVRGPIRVKSKSDKT